MIKQNQSRPPMAMHVQRQLSKNVVQHPTLGHHHPGWQMEQRPGGLLKLMDAVRDITVAVPSSPVCAFPNKPITDTLHQHLGSPRGTRCVILEDSREAPSPALPPWPSQHLSVTYEVSEPHGDGAGHPGRKMTYHRAACFVLLSPSAYEGSC